MERRPLRVFGRESPDSHKREIAAFYDKAEFNLKNTR